MHRMLRSLLIALTLLASPPALATAGDSADPCCADVDTPCQADAGDPCLASQQHVDVRLMTDVNGVVPGETFRVGVLFEVEEGWHVYWRYAGETGLPTEIGFQAPDGFELRGMRWPTPTRIESDSGIVSYGYEEDVLLFTEVTAPPDILEGEAITLTAHADWLVCHENCIPGTARLSLPLHVRSDAGPSDHRPVFEAAGERIPGPLPEDLKVDTHLSVSGVAPGDTWEMAILLGPESGAPLEDVRFYPAPADGLHALGVAVEDEGTHVPDGGAMIRVKGRASGDASRSGARLDGVLEARRGDRTIRAHLGAPLPRMEQGQTAVSSDHPVFADAEAASGSGPKAPGDIEPTPAAVQSAGAATQPSDEPGEGPSMALMLLFAFLGGLILNVMPCVLPVLSIKILGLVQQADDDRSRIWRHGLSYTVGILLSFAFLAVLVIALKTSGKLVGWGFQFQNPMFVAAMGAIVFTFGLSLFGVFEIQAPGSHKLNAAAASRHGYGGSFMNGVLATILATPCTAPFLAPALGFAMSQPPAVLLGFLLMIGFGLAFPFLLLAALPRWADLMPKPGPWMNTFKKAMGFLLVATTVWLVDVLAAQVTRAALVHYLGFLAVLALAAWIYGHWGGLERAARTRWISAITAVAVAAVGGWQLLHFDRPTGSPGDQPAAVAEGEIPWRDFTSIDVEALAAEGKTVFIDFTADWCVTCKVYERTVINTDLVKGALSDTCVVPVRADYTNEDPKITEWLERFQRPGVPMYVILPAGRPGEPMLLPEVLTKAALLDGLEESTPAGDGACPT
ncbi:MAG: protein-disulfide reductase DsbD family protein [Myxococcota bacterium]